MSAATPIFIHSLFRSGSTYIFQAFRRCSDKFWCYQEPLHEITYLSRKDCLGFNLDIESDEVRLLRHPLVEGGYFKELIDVWPVWKEKIHVESIYDNYFSASLEDSDKAFWQSLIDASPRRPLFQECRTSGRIGAIKGSLGGVHVYLWRNPWDQWWSYKVNPYFDATNRLFLHSKNALKSAKILTDSFGLNSFSSPCTDILATISFYIDNPSRSEQSYQLFYLLWCLALKEGLQYADLLLNVDQLSDSADYRSEILTSLKRLGVSCVDFSDCVSPQARYSDSECAWFSEQESKVHACLLEGGWDCEDLKRVHNFRDNHKPKLWTFDFTGEVSSRYAEHASRARDLCRRFETALAERVRQAGASQQELSVHLVAAEESQHLAEARSIAAKESQHLAEARSIAAKESQHLAEARAIAAEESQHLAEARSIALFDELTSMIGSKSWKVTKPLRQSLAYAKRLKRFVKFALMGVVYSRPQILPVRILKRIRSTIKLKPTVRKFFLAIFKKFPHLMLCISRTLGPEKKDNITGGAMPNNESLLRLTRIEKIVSQVLDRLENQK